MNACQKTEEARCLHPVTPGASCAAPDTPENACECQDDLQGDLSDGDYGCPDCCEQPGPKKSGLPDLAFIVLLVMASQAIWFSPEIIRAVAKSGEIRERVFLGTVQRVTFIGGLVPSTQVDTENQTFLLRGAASLAQGARLERRRWLGDPEVCDMQSGECWQLMSH